MSELKINGFATTPAEWAKITSVLADINKDSTMNAVEDGELTTDEMSGILGGLYVSGWDYSRFNGADLKELYSKYLDTPKYAFARSSFFSSRGFSLFVMEKCYLSGFSSSLSGEVDTTLLNDRNFVLRLVAKRGSALQIVNDKFKSDEEVVSVAIENDAEAVKFVDPSFKFSRKYLLTALKKNGELLNGLSDEDKNDSELVLAALENNPSAIKYASPELLDSNAFLLSVIKVNPWALEEIKEKVQDDRALALASVKENGWTIRIFSEALQNDKEVLINAVRSTSGLYETLSDVFKQDRDVVLAMVSKNGRALQYLSPEFRADREIVLSAVTDYGKALEFADDSLKSDKVIVLAASHNGAYYENYRSDKAQLLKEVEWDSFAFAVASPNLKNDISFSTSMAQKNLNVFRFMTSRQKVAYWNFFVEKFNDRLSPFFTNDELSTYDTFLKAMKDKYDIEFVRRLYGLETLTEVLSNLTDPTNTDDTRPRAVLIYNRSDWNGGFESTAMSTELIGLGYRVLYYDVEDEASAIAKLDEATGNGSVKIDLLIFGGHGNSTSLDFGSGGDEKYFIDTSDFTGEDTFQLSNYMSENGQIILDACSNGAGGKDDQENLANTVARTVPAGVSVQAAVIDTAVEGIAKAKDGVAITFCESKTYKVFGSLSTGGE